jgi:hypothetical protein
MCESLVEQVDAALLEKHFLGPILKLASDRVPNVRFSIARVLSQKLIYNGMIDLVRVVFSLAFWLITPPL